MKESIKNLDRKLESVYSNLRHRTEASNGVFCACIRHGIDPDKFLLDIENGSAFDFNSFSKSRSGNLLDFLHVDYHSIAQMLIDITAGGNGGMASIGRCEFFISFLSNFKSRISTEGRGDLKCDGKYEEVKYNGGKICFEKKAGNEIHRSFIELMEQCQINLKTKDYVFNRKSDRKLYSEFELNVLNGVFWQAITNEVTEPLTNKQWTSKAIARGFQDLFEHVDSLILINEDNDFVRFFSASEAIEFYEDKLDIMMSEFELRMHQSNVPSFYVGKTEINA